MVYHLDGYWFPIAKPMVDVSDENEVKRRVGRQANRQSTVDLGHLAPLLFCWAVGSCWAQSPEHFLLADAEEETSSNCLGDSKNGGPFWILRAGKSSRELLPNPKSTYIFYWAQKLLPQSWLPAHAFPTSWSCFNEVTILGLHH